MGDFFFFFFGRRIENGEVHVLPMVHTAVLQLYPDTVVDLPGYSRLYSYLHVVY